MSGGDGGVQVRSDDLMTTSYGTQCTRYVRDRFQYVFSADERYCFVFFFPLSLGNTVQAVLEPVDDATEQAKSQYFQLN